MKSNQRKTLLYSKLVLCFTVAACTKTSGSSNTDATVSTSTKFYPKSNQRMALRLQTLAKHTDYRNNEFANHERMQALLKQTPPTHPGQRFKFETQLALEELNAGESIQAASRFRMLVEILEQAKMKPDPIHKKQLLHSLGIAQLRQGEQENCVANHNQDTCLFPLKGGGIHRKPEGARGAYETYLKILEADPRDFGARWLLNIAGMAANIYPDQISKQWLIPETAFASETPFPRFRNIAEKVGIGVHGLAGGVAFDDFNGDGRMDVMMSSWGQSDQLRFFVSTESGFQEQTDHAGLTGLTGGLNLIHADYDNDGDQDVFVLRGAWRYEAGRLPNSLLQNNGQGQFTDVSIASGLGEAHPTQTAVFADFDNDGHLDIFIGNESSPVNSHPAELFRNNQNGTFTNVAISAGADIRGYIKGVSAGDFDNDGRIDLYVSRLDSKNHLLRNLSSGVGVFKFQDVTATANVGAASKTFPTWFFDFNNDGWLDIFVLAYHASPGDLALDYLKRPHQGMRPYLFENLKNGRFRDTTEAQGLDRPLLAMGCNFGDLDNDSWLDIYIGTGDPNLTSLMPNRMFRNNGGKGFQDVSTAGGFGHLQKGHGVAFVDFDEDGDQDVFAVMGGAYSGDAFSNVLFENPGTPNNWIKLKLEGVQSNRSAIGARIEIVAGKRHIHSVVSSGGSFGASPLRREIGLGNAKHIDQINILWPSGQKQTLKHRDVNQTLVIKER